MDYQYELTRPDSPTFKMKSNNINGLVRVTNNYIKDDIKYQIKVMGIPLNEYLMWKSKAKMIKYYGFEEVA